MTTTGRSQLIKQHKDQNSLWNPRNEDRSTTKLSAWTSSIPPPDKECAKLTARRISLSADEAVLTISSKTKQYCHCHWVELITVMAKELDKENKRFLILKKQKKKEIIV